MFYVLLIIPVIIGLFFLARFIPSSAKIRVKKKQHHRHIPVATVEESETEFESERFPI